ncbi:MAG: beta-ketoacyl-[acyl-carrier-protein] synthase II [Spirochaetes bacterium]|nr:MAG: beta-ketoacyl-[acyl-carrier-protein] synthase II [Spirochaetota bacterium]
MSDRRIVITGMGVISPNGIGKEAFWNATINGKSGISKIESFDPSRIPTKIGGEVKEFDPSPWIDEKTEKRVDRNIKFGLCTARMALEDAGLDLSSDEKALNTGVIIGTAVGGQGYMLEQDAIVHQKGPMKISLFSALNSFPDACAGQIALLAGIKGPNFAVSTACSSALDAIGVGLNYLRSGRLSCVITGGSEAPIFEPIFAAFCKIHAMSTRNDEPEKASRPFDKGRDGFVMGEGAGMFVLEDYEHARKRGAKIYAEILGYGTTCDAYHMTMPHPEGEQAVRAINLALKEAEISPDEVDYINAHGTSTPLNDKTETLTIKEVFKERAKSIPISAVKSMIGHLIGAAGAVELVASILTIERGVIPPTINYEEPDPECDLDYVPNQAREKDVKVVVKNSFGFGGKNSVLVIKKV